MVGSGQEGEVEAPGKAGLRPDAPGLPGPTPLPRSGLPSSGRAGLTTSPCLWVADPSSGASWGSRRRGPRTGTRLPAGRSRRSLASRRTGGASSCRPSTTSSTTRLRCSSTPARPTATTGVSGACTSSRPRTGWTAATRPHPSGEPTLGGGGWGVGSGGEAATGAVGGRSWDLSAGPQGLLGEGAGVPEPGPKGELPCGGVRGLPRGRGGGGRRGLLWVGGGGREQEGDRGEEQKGGTSEREADRMEGEREPRAGGRGSRAEILGEAGMERGQRAWATGQQGCRQGPHSCPQTRVFI